MSFLRRAGGQISLLVLSLIGAGISIYLILVHYNSEVPLACSTTGIINCENVLASPYAYVPGTAIPISIPGLLWCLGGAALALAAWRIWPGRRVLYIAELVWTSLGMLSVLYLVYVEIVRLGNICLWCTFLHVVILLMFLISVVQLQGSRTDDEYEEEEEEEYSTSPGARKA